MSKKKKARVGERDKENTLCWKIKSEDLKEIIRKIDDKIKGRSKMEDIKQMN